MPTITTNKQGLSDYEILDKFEAGIMLSGAEVKSARSGHINLKGSYVTISPKSEVFLIDAHIAAYGPAKGKQEGYSPIRERKLLLSKKEIDLLRGKEKEKGLTIMPISVYTKGSLIKVSIGVGRGKKKFDKRQDIKKRDINRDIRQALRGKL